MATIESKKIPIFYYETTTTGSSVAANKTLYTVFDTELKKTFVYDSGFTLGSRKPLATIDTSGKITPFQENGKFIASKSLRDELESNQAIQDSIKTSTRKAVRDYIGLNDPTLIKNVTNLQIDKVMGTTVSKNDEPAPPAPPASAARPAPQPQGTPTTNQPVIIPDDPVKDSPQNVKPYYGNYQYPEKIGRDQDFVKFTMYRYKPKGLNSSTLNDGITKSNSVKGGGKGSVSLAIQSPASDSNTVGWGDGRLTGIEAALFNVALTGVDKGMTAMMDNVGKKFEELVKEGYQKELGIYFAQQAAQVNDVFARATGGILNPNLELLFQAPELRSFNFTFKLSARDKPEADMIRKIIRFFKQGMSVKKAGSALFLKSPDIFDIQYYKGGGDKHKSLNKFKTCALRGFNVDYTPLGSYMTYSDPAATMVAYTISMQFQEIDPIYDDDYQKMPDDVIGY